MELTTVEAKERHSFNYYEYFKPKFYYECLECATIVESLLGHCSECLKELEQKNQQQLFCSECRQPINEKRDYFRNKKDFVSHLPVNYLKCQCPENLWIPFIKTNNFSESFDPISDDDIFIWTICCAEPSQYSNNADVYFINCQLKEHELFLKPYIKFNIDRNAKLSTSERKEFVDRYYRICRDVISLGIKLGILRELIRDETHIRRLDARSPNTIQEILDFSGSRFKYELLTSILENSFARLRRLFNPNPKGTENTVVRYRNDFLKTSYPNTYKSERKKHGIPKLGGQLIALTNKEILHDDIDFNKGIFLKDCHTLFNFYNKEVLETIDTLNKMHQFKLLFNYEDSLSPLGLENTGRHILHNFLKVSDNALTSYKDKQVLELLGLDNFIDNGDLPHDKRKECERKRNIYEHNLISYFKGWIIFNHPTPLNIIMPEGQHFEMHYGFNSMRLTETHDGNYIIYIKTLGTLCRNFRIECFGNDENFAKQIFREIQYKLHKQETVDLSDFKYNSSMQIF